MSWQTINHILNTAVTDPDFCRLLLQDPLRAIAQHAWKLTREEREILAGIQAQDLAEFSQRLLQHLPPDKKASC